MQARIPMNAKALIIRDPLITDLCQYGLDATALENLCVTVENMNDDHLLGVAVDTLLDMRDILKLDINAPEISYHQNEIQSRFEAVENNFNIYLVLLHQQLERDNKNKRFKTMKELLNPLIEHVISLRKPPFCPEI